MQRRGVSKRGDEEIQKNERDEKQRGHVNGEGKKLKKVRKSKVRVVKW